MMKGFRLNSGVKTIMVILLMVECLFMGFFFGYEFAEEKFSNCMGSFNDDLNKDMMIDIRLDDDGNIRYCLIEYDEDLKNEMMTHYYNEGDGLNYFESEEAE